MSEEPKQQFNVYLSPHLIRQIKHAAVDERQSLSELVERALDNHVERIQRHGREMTLMALVYVSDVDRSIAFYEQLGLTLSLRGRTGLWAELTSGSGLLALHHVEVVPTPARERVALSFVLSESLDSVCTRLQAADIPIVRPVTDEEFGRSMVIRDPDGLMIQFNEHDPDLYA